jgi:hypothetical protein
MSIVAFLRVFLGDVRVFLCPTMAASLPGIESTRCSIRPTSVDGYGRQIEKSATRAQSESERKLRRVRVPPVCWKVRSDRFLSGWGSIWVIEEYSIRREASVGISLRRKYHRRTAASQCCTRRASTFRIWIGSHPCNSRSLFDRRLPNVGHVFAATWCLRLAVISWRVSAHRAIWGRALRVTCMVRHSVTIQIFAHNGIPENPFSVRIIAQDYWGHKLLISKVSFSTAFWKMQDFLRETLLTRDQTSWGEFKYFWGFQWAEVTINFVFRWSLHNVIRTE